MVGGTPEVSKISHFYMGSKAKLPSDRSLKRVRTEATVPLKTTDNTQAFSKFLVTHCEYELPLGKLSPFLVAKTLESCVGKSYKAKKLRSGDLLVEVETEQQSKALLGLTSIADRKVTVTPHRSLNTIRGVISEDDLLESTEDEILEGLSNQGVIAVRRITFRREDQEKPSKHLVLTFNSTTLPQTVKAGYLNCKVRPFIPNPRRCFSCQRFGHGAATCRGRTTCGKCSSNDHPTDSCASDFSKCVNCSGAHPAYSRSCPKFKEEKEILTLKTKENLTYFEARKRLSFLQRGTYAAAVSKGAAPTTASVGTQVCLLDLSAPRKPQAPKISPGIPQEQRDSTQTASSKATAPRRMPARPRDKTVTTESQCLEGRPSCSSHREVEAMDVSSSPPEPPPAPKVGKFSSKVEDPKKKTKATGPEAGT